MEDGFALVLGRWEAMTERLVFSKDDLIIPEGSSHREAYIIEKGSVEVSQRDEKGEKVVLAIRGEKEIIGEMALIGGTTRCATIIALEDCEVSVLSLEQFKKLPNSNPGVKAIKKIMQERINS